MIIKSKTFINLLDNFISFFKLFYLIKVINQDSNIKFQIVYNLLNILIFFRDRDKIIFIKNKISCPILKYLKN